MKKYLQKISQSDLVQSFFKFLQSSDLDLSSIAVAYYLLVTVFPLLFLLSAFLPYLNINVKDILEVLRAVLPEQVYKAVDDVILSILTKPSTSWLGIFIVTMLWTFSQSMAMLQKAFNKAYGVQEHRSFFLSRLVGLLAGILLQIALTVAVLLGIFGRNISTWLQQRSNLETDWLLNAVEVTRPVVYIGLFLVLVMLYLLLPNVRIRKIRYVLPGSIFVVLVLLTTSNLISYYLREFLTHYGDFRLVSYLVLLVILIWFIFIARLLIFGAVLNATYQTRREGSFSTGQSTIRSWIGKVKWKKSDKG